LLTNNSHLRVIKECNATELHVQCWSAKTEQKNYLNAAMSVDFNIEFCESVNIFITYNWF